MGDALETLLAEVAPTVTERGDCDGEGVVGEPGLRGDSVGVDGSESVLIPRLSLALSDLRLFSLVCIE